MPTPVPPPSERPLGLFEARRALTRWERVALVVSALVLLNLWIEVLGLAAAGSPWGHVNFRLQWVGTFQLALIVYAGSVAWLFALWRHELARTVWVRRALGWPPLRGIVELPVPPRDDGQSALF